MDLKIIILNDSQILGFWTTNGKKLYFGLCYVCGPLYQFLPDFVLMVLPWVFGITQG